MENNEILVNEEIIESVTDEVAEICPKKGMSAGVVFGAAVLVTGGLALGYKFIAKPLIAKLKAKKAEKAAIIEANAEVNDCEEDI